MTPLSRASALEERTGVPGLSNHRRRISIEVSGSGVRVSGFYLHPEKSRFLFVFGHGAGAGMTHSFMESMAQKLALRGIASLRYQFPYMEEGRKRPDQKPVLLATVRSAVREACKLDGSLPILAGGKSMGGRMTSLALAEEPLSEVRSLVFFGFPLHPPDSPSTERAIHLSHVTVPMLFLQGTRDKLADLKLLEPVVKKLGKLATLQIVEGADHSFHVPRSLGKSDDAVLDHLSDVVISWTSRVVA
ncbi:MAG TPA: alpha/beta family hydrolase [Bacteroidota bacterium]|nr:alpha/beta family hydrolase [Bacteroidota bacterium]